MKLTSVKSLFSVLLALVTISVAHAEERVVATIDGYPIMQSQLTKVLGKRANTEANRKSALDNLIVDYLIQRAIQESGIEINYAYVDQMIEEVAMQNGLTYGQLLDALDYQGITLEKYREQIAQQIIMDQVRQKIIGKVIQRKVEPEQVKALAQQMMEKDKARGKLKKTNGLEHRISHILLKTNPILTNAKAKAKLTQLVADIQAGKVSFEESAKTNSVDYASGAEGGDLGWNILEVYDPAFANVAKKSKVGVISKPFKSQFGWHILKVTDTRKIDRTEDAYMQKAYQKLMSEQAEIAAKNWEETLKSRADIKYLP